MIDFPSSTKVGRRMPKEAFYKHLPLSATLKAKFVSDVDRITVENSLTKENLNLAKETDVKEILLLSILLKKQDFDGKIVETITRQNPHKLILLLEYENQRQLAIYYKKLYRSKWVQEEALNLRLSGDTLDAIWEDLVRQIAVHSDALLGKNDLTIDEQLENQDEIDKLNMLIGKTETEAWKEQQPKKKFELYKQVQKYKEQLEELTHGKA